MAALPTKERASDTSMNFPHAQDFRSPQKLDTLLNTRYTSPRIWACGLALPAHTYKRCVVGQTVGRPLEQYKEAKELCRGLLDSLKAHEQAWTKASVLHGDINDSNIVIVGEDPSDSRGLLIKWDVCKDNAGRPVKSDSTSDNNRLGSWCFMSAVQTRFPFKEINISDDIESFLNLVLWFSARFHKTSLSNLHFHLQVYFEGTDLTADHRLVPIGHHERYTRIEQGLLASTMIIKHARLRSIGSLLMALCGQHYRTFTTAELEAWSLPNQEFHTAANHNDPISALLSLPAAKVLETHDKSIEVFERELKKSTGWDVDNKGDDRFAKMIFTHGRRRHIHPSGFKRSKRHKLAGRIFLALYYAPQSGEDL
ncbi:hypothetical protein K474DRAFT_1710389 [Panus rudis PR-1116 ss-1]|nr:hypothetical protein K474DRAFT_1710389 [Panus rudis PR-1116 ss-1]